MKSNIVIGTIILATVIAPSAYASAVPESSSVAEPSSSPSPAPTPTATPSPSPSPTPTTTPTPNVDTLPPPSQELVQQNPWQYISVDPAPNNSAIEPPSQDELETWAVVDANGNTLNIISCDRDYCGSGWIPTKFEGSTPVEFARVVLQSARNPQTGENNGGHWGNYNFSSNTWTKTNSDGSVYEMPKEHDSKPICIENCPTIFPTPEPLFSESVNLQSVTIEKNSETSIQERSISVKPAIINNDVVINKKINDKIFKNQVLIIATKGNSKKLWKQQVSGKIVNIKIPRKYLFWNISIRYLVG